jgi:hypothetical protein
VLQEVHREVSEFKDFFKRRVLPEVASKTTTQTVLVESCRKFLHRVERAGSKTTEVRGISAE